MYSLQSLGGQATAKKLRSEALHRYYLKPNICLKCGKVIIVPDGMKVQRSRRKKFCDHSCAASYCNSNKMVKIKKCIICGNPSSSKYSKYCDNCRKMVTHTLGSKKIGEIQITRNGLRMNKYSKICAQARYLHSKSSNSCQRCGYSKHIEVCHISPISSFDPSTPISVINSAENIIILCPNCHWELDNGLIKHDDIISST